MSSELESVNLPAELLEEPRGDIAAAHVVHCTQRRDWPVVTSDPEPLLTLNSLIEIESLA